MKLLAIMLFAFVMQLEASTRAQTVTIVSKKTTIKQVFLEIKKQTGYDFFYANEDIAHAGSFSVSIKNRPLVDALNSILTTNGLRFDVNNKSIFVEKDKRAIKAEASVDKIQQELITGTVLDSLGNTLSGVTIVIVGKSGEGTKTDAKGHFELKAPLGSKLLFSYVGYNSQELTVANYSPLRIVLSPIQEALDEVVVVGFGTQRKIQTLGSQSTLSVADLKQPVANITTVLAGRISGLVGVQRSGEPGLDGAQLWVRGVNTLNSGLAHPLVIVDGVERDFNNLDPNDIESFTILKDASSTSVYGVRGANGVILITTKKGMVGDTKINVEYLQGVTQFTQVPQQADGVTYMQMANEALVTRGQSPLYTEEAIRKTYTQEDPYLFPNVNWMNEIFNDFGKNRKANLNIRGGSDKMQYYVSAGLYGETGLFKTDDLQKYNAKISFDRYNFSSSLNIKATKTTDIDLGVKGYITNGNYPGTGTADLFRSTFDTYPIIYPVKYPNGQEPYVSTGGGMANPYYLLTNRGYVTTYENQLMSDIHVKQKLDFLTEGLSARVLYSFDARNTNRLLRKKSPSTYYATGRDENGELVYQLTSEGKDFLSFDRENTGRRQFYLESSLNYSRNFGEHSITGLFLFNQSDRISANATDLIGSLPYRSRGIVGRGSYSYADRYLAEVSFGYNGAENFAPEFRYGLFPSYAVGWVPSNERFWQGLDSYVQKLKVRGSYGKVGSSTIEGRRFAYIEVIGGVGGYFYGRERDNNIGGLDITEYASNASWEIETNWNLGLELGLLKNSLQIDLDYFNRDRENIFLNRASVPESAGFRSNLLGNLGETNARGLDASMNYNTQFGAFSTMIRGTFTYSKNKVIENDQPIQPYPHMERRGHAIGQRFGYIVDGFYTQQEIDDPSVARTVGVVQAGDLKFKDLNEDGLIDGMDYAAIGKSDIPQIVYGFGTTIGYKGFSLGAFFQGVGRTDFYMSNRFMPFLEGTARGGLYENITDRWTEDNPRQDAFYPRLSHGNLNQNYSSTNSHWLMDGSFLRLKTLDFGYTIPPSIFQKYGVSNMRVYFVGYNLWTISSFKMYDPELGNGDGLKYPNIKTFSMGLNLTF
ncbi:TonB-dependent receptor [Sphingobacterium sp. SYP-B4668]|uniref:TonB-dependent receptor n=1 Tax=Sphingobacterium sp. SYP-B4668 TaxID=2996035 RepID=UPI0022DDE244|nr:TonB-dependent receptor [Sphingobacterium sp. SYP-B4668]